MCGAYSFKITSSEEEEKQDEYICSQNLINNDSGCAYNKDEYQVVCDGKRSGMYSTPCDPGMFTQEDPKYAPYRGFLINVASIEARLKAAIESECARGKFIQALRTTKIRLTGIRSLFADYGGFTCCEANGKHYIVINVPYYFKKWKVRDPVIPPVFPKEMLKDIEDTLIHELWHIVWGCKLDCEYHLALVMKCSSLMGVAKGSHRVPSSVLRTIHCECCACFDYRLRRESCEGPLSDY